MERLNFAPKNPGCIKCRYVKRKTIDEFFDGLFCAHPNNAEREWSCCRGYYNDYDSCGRFNDEGQCLLFEKKFGLISWLRGKLQCAS